jgi:hypothetical protein
MRSEFSPVFMAKIKIHIWHDIKGGIVAVGHPVMENKALKLGFIPIGTPNFPTIETEIEQELVANFHKTHTVDVKNRSLVTRPEY